MPDIIKELQKNKVLFFDGAMGTQLIEMGCKIGGCPESWNIIKNKKLVYGIHKSYVDAGSDIIETNTFGANIVRLGIFGLEEKTYEINKAAAQNARKAAGRKKMVCGSIGPTGKIHKHHDRKKEKELLESFMPQVQGLVDGGADFLCVETILDLFETRCILRCIGEISPKTPVAATISYKKTGNSYSTFRNVPLRDSIKQLVNLPVCAVGTNCNLTIEDMIPVIETMRGLTELPLIAQPCAGHPVLHKTKVRYKETPEKMAEHVNELMDAGAGLLGGCCGTTPAHIKEMAAGARKVKPKNL